MSRRSPAPDITQAQFQRFVYRSEPISDEQHRTFNALAAANKRKMDAKARQAGGARSAPPTDATEAPP